MRNFLILFIFILGTSAHAKFEIDRSHEIFLPPHLKKSIGDYKNFSVFWWNFIIIEASEFETQLPKLETICTELKKGFFARVECSQSLKDYEPYVRDWVRDWPTRSPMPERKRFESTFGKAMAEASLPMGHDLIQLLRLDPSQEWMHLKELASRRLEHFMMTRAKGFLYDEKSKRVLIPVQMGTRPNETAQTLRAKDEVEKLVSSQGFDFTLVGPHWSTLQNETQITRDVHMVSWFGTTILVLFVLFLIYCKRTRAILTIPPVFIGVFASAGITMLVFGSIHGLTLAFGSAIIGLAIDYGLHGAFSKHHQKTWKSNAVGMFTTLAGLLIMMTSTIPLIRQLMFFSCIGLVLAFLCLYFISVAWPDLIKAEPFSIRPKPNKLKTVVILSLMLVAGFSPLILKPDFDMRGFDFQSEKTKQVTGWLFKDLKIRSPLFEIHPEAIALTKIFEEQQWARENGIGYESLANYTVSLAAQTENVKSWKDCAFKTTFSPEQQEFFDPFFKAICYTRDDSVVRTYNAHLTDGPSWVSLWFPEKDQEDLVAKKYPNATSIAGLVSSFPATLLNELRYMIPLSILLASALLYWYYRRIILTGFALIPFLSGVGLVSLVHIFFNVDVSFITLIGLVMVFGFSIDYGIFVTDATLVDTSATDVWSAISFAALTNLAGFAPLLICEHPVLKHLGQALFFGTVGTYIGAVWGITGLEKYAKKTS